MEASPGTRTLGGGDGGAVTVGGAAGAWEEEVRASVLRRVWGGGIPLQVSLDPREVTTPEEPRPIFIMGPRCGYLPMLVPQLKAHFEAALPPGPDTPWFDFQGLPLKWHLPIGVLWDLLGSPQAPRLPWPLTVHFRSYPREVLLAWEEEEETVKWAFVNNLKEAVHIIQGSAKPVMQLPSSQHSMLWASLVSRSLPDFESAVATLPAPWHTTSVAPRHTAGSDSKERGRGKGGKGGKPKASTGDRDHGAQRRPTKIALRLYWHEGTYPPQAHCDPPEQRDPHLARAGGGAGGNAGGGAGGGAGRGAVRGAAAERGVGGGGERREGAGKWPADWGSVQQATRAVDLASLPDGVTLVECLRHCAPELLIRTASGTPGPAGVGRVASADGDCAGEGEGNRSSSCSAEVGGTGDRGTHIQDGESSALGSNPRSGSGSASASASASGSRGDTSGSSSDGGDLPGAPGASGGPSTQPPAPSMVTPSTSGEETEEGRGGESRRGEGEEGTSEGGKEAQGQGQAGSWAVSVAVIHGLITPWDAAMCQLASHLCSPDFFLHICLH